MEKPLPAWSRRPVGRKRMSHRPMPTSITTTTTTTLPNIGVMHRSTVESHNILDSHGASPHVNRKLPKQKTAKQFHGTRQTDRNMDFLQEQHKQVLSSLYQEIQDLKAENKDLKFRLIMLHAKPAKAPESSYQQELETTRSELEKSRKECHQLRREVEEFRAQEMYVGSSSPQNTIRDMSERMLRDEKSKEAYSSEVSRKGRINLPAINSLNL